MQSSVESVPPHIMVPRSKVPLLGLLALLGLLIYGGFSLAGGSSLLRSANSFESQGLGITRLEFERLHNLPSNVIQQPYWSSESNYPEQGYFLRLWFNNPETQSFEDAFIRSIEVNLPGKKVIDIQKIAQGLLPADAKLIEIKEARGGGQGHPQQLIYKYRSGSLAERYPALPGIPDPWKGHTPGEFVVIIYPGLEGVTINADLTSLGKVEPPQPTRPPTRTPFNSLTPAPPPMPVYTVPMPEPSMPLPVPSPRR